MKAIQKSLGGKADRVEKSMESSSVLRKYLTAGIKLVIVLRASDTTAYTEIARTGFRRF